MAFLDNCVLAWFELGHGRMFSSDAPLQYGVAFTVLLLFITSAVVAVYQRGSGDVADSERYNHYAREVRRIRQHGQPSSADSFFRMVEQTEQIELRELFDFCRDVAHSSYVL